MIPAKDRLNLTPPPPTDDTAPSLADVRDGVPLHYYSPLFQAWVWIVRDKSHKARMALAGCKLVCYTLYELHHTKENDLSDAIQRDLYMMKSEAPALTISEVFKCGKKPRPLGRRSHVIRGA